MKRFIVFAHEEFEPQGGWDDVVADSNGLVRSTDSLEEAREILSEAKRAKQDRGCSGEEDDIVVKCYGHIVDLTTGQKVR